MLIVVEFLTVSGTLNLLAILPHSSIMMILSLCMAREIRRAWLLQGGQTTPLGSHLADLAATEKNYTTSCFSLRALSIAPDSLVSLFLSTFLLSLRLFSSVCLVGAIISPTKGRLSLKQRLETDKPKNLPRRTHYSSHHRKILLPTRALRRP